MTGPPSTRERAPLTPLRLCVIASASGNGKTTLAQLAAARLGVPFVELDALVHGPGWTETPSELLRAQLHELLAADGWVIDGAYTRKLGDLVLRAADQIVWLDLPIRTWMPRLIRRTVRRLATREELWNGNRESLRSVIGGTDSLVVHAVRTHFRRRREWPAALQAFPVVRLRSAADVSDWLGAL
jgi:adenylate kinase family enzyme